MTLGRRRLPARCLAFGRWSWLVGAFWALTRPAWAQRPAFTVVPLGVKGGLAEGNLSAYLVAAAGRPAYVCLMRAACGRPRSGWSR